MTVLTTYESISTYTSNNEIHQIENEYEDVEVIPTVTETNIDRTFRNGFIMYLSAGIQASFPSCQVK